MLSWFKLTMGNFTGIFKLFCYPCYWKSDIFLRYKATDTNPEKQG